MIEQPAGKVAVVTGGASGIGFALAQRFLAEQMAVVLADIDADALIDAASRLRASGGEVLDVVVDVSDPGQVEGLAGASLERFGAVHLLCNNAGVATSGSVWDVPLSDWDWVLGVNLLGTVHGIRAFLPRMLERGGPGHIVNTASMAGLVPVQSSPTYTVSKFGVVALSEVLYLQLRDLEAGVGVSVVCPGWVRTRLAESQRHRPDSAGQPAGATTGDGPVAAGDRAGPRRSLRRALAEAMDPAEVAARVLDAVRTDRFYVLPHDADEWLAPLRARMESILARRNPSDPDLPGSESVTALPPPA
jgi:NAD(P)-dependent dehydrogenase (short-subunit alcohol dehydrogenase family)